MRKLFGIKSKKKEAPQAPVPTLGETSQMVSKYLIFSWEHEVMSLKQRLTNATKSYNQFSNNWRKPQKPLKSESKWKPAKFLKGGKCMKLNWVSFKINSLMLTKWLSQVKQSIQTSICSTRWNLQLRLSKNKWRKSTMLTWKTYTTTWLIWWLIKKKLMNWCNETLGSESLMKMSWWMNSMSSMRRSQWKS